MTVLTERIDLSPPDRAEISRYAGCPAGSEPPLLNECLAELDITSGKVCYAVVERKKLERYNSVTLAKFLGDSDRAIVFAATVGIGVDRLISRYARLSPARALVFQAIGAERIEDLCDVFCKAKGLHTRCSPGYGDIPFEMQRDIFALLDCPRRIGLTLNGSLLMSPSKSVTAIGALNENT